MVARIKHFFTIFIAFGILLVSFALFLQSASAQTTTDTPTPTATPTATPDTTMSDVGDCVSLHLSASDCVNYYQNKLNSAQSQDKTLSSQISVMTNQINLTQARIANTQVQIQQLTAEITTTSTKIATIEGSLSSLTKVLLDHIVATYKVGTNQDFGILLSSNTISDFFQRANYLRIVQDHDKQLIYDTVQAKNDYANQQNIFETKKRQVEALQNQLQDYTAQLGQEKIAKQQLLVDTQGSESTYQQLLATAQAHLAALEGFSSARVGSGGGVIPHQELSDGWGKYYNQRDANWGNNYIGSSNYQVWSVGCLLTSYSMVVTHFGGSVNPGDVAANGEYFSFADFRIPGPSANGHSATYVTNPSIDSLKSEVQAGNPVVAGLSANGGPYPTHYSDHWVVLRGLDGSGNFIINDPWYAGGMNVSINDHYSGWAIIEARIYH